jgi:drug/metabolite transporter (DMT)-like permease
MPGVALTPPSHRGTGIVLALLGAIGFSGKAIIAKLAYRHGVDAVTVVMYRMLFALPLFLSLTWWATRRAGANVAPLTRGDWLGVFGLGFCGYYASSMLDFMGLQFISASLERLILYLNPTLVLLLGWLLYRRPITTRQAVAMAVSYAGVLLVFRHELGLEGEGVVQGGLLVFGSAVCYAVYLVYSGELVKRIGSLRLVGWATSVACALCLLHFVLLRPLSAARVPEAVLWLSALNALACTAAPVLMVMMAVERIGPGLAAQMGMVGPMSTILLGVLLLGEPFNRDILVGTVLVLAGALWVTRQRA